MLSTQTQKVISFLSKNPKYSIFYKCLIKYNLLHLLDKKNITLFIPLNLSFYKQFSELDKLCDEKMTNLFMRHIVPRSIKSLQIGKFYSSLINNHVISITGEKKINNTNDVAGNPIVIDNAVIYLIRDVIID